MIRRSTDKEAERSTRSGSRATAGAAEKPPMRQRYNTTWESDGPFRDWIARSNRGSNFARCRYCRMDFPIGDGGRADLIRHRKSNSHRERETKKLSPPPTSPSKSASPAKKIKYLQRYNKKWESDDNFKSWLAPNPSKGDTFAYCKTCQLDLAIGSGRVELLRHLKRRKHQQNAKILFPGEDSGQPDEYKERYCDKWESEDLFRDWLSPNINRGVHYAYCRICEFDLSVASAGRMDLLRHSKSKRHLDNLLGDEERLPEVDNVGEDVLSSPPPPPAVAAAVGSDIPQPRPKSVTTGLRCKKRKKLLVGRKEGPGKKAKYMQRYHEDWEDDDMFKDWLTHSANKGILFAYCKFCNIDLAIGSSGKIDLIRHLQSQKHQRNRDEPYRSQPVDGRDEMPRTDMASPYKKAKVGSSKETASASLTDDSQDSKFKGWCRQRFREEWCKEPNFYGWLEPVPEDPFRAWCKCCQCTLSVGRSELMKHALTAKHKRGMIDVNSTGANVLSILEGASGTGESILAVNKHGLSRMVDESQLRAELRIAAFCVQHDLTNQGVQQLSDLINGMADSPDVVGRMHLSRDKCATLVKLVLARSVHHELDEVLQHLHFSLIVEEPTASGNVSSCTDRRIFCVVAKYFSEAKNRVRSELLETFAVDALDGEDPSTKALCDIIVERLCRRRIPLKNLVGVAADLACPLLADMTALQQELLSEAGSQTVVFNAVHHSMITVAIKALSVLPSSLHELMHHFGGLVLGQSRHLHGVGTERLAWSTTGDIRMRFSTVHPSHWLASPACVNALATALPELVILLNGAVERTCSAVCQALLASAMDPYVRAYVHFLAIVLGYFHDIEEALPSGPVLLPHFLRECQKRFRALCQHFMAPSAFMVEERDLALVDPFDAQNVLPLKDIYVGVDCRDYLNSLGGVAALQNEEFLRVCLRFLQTAADEVRRRVPLGGDLLEHLAFLDPEVALRAEGRGRLPSLSGLSAKLPGDPIDPEKLDAQWTALPQYFSAADADELQKLPVDSMWGIIANMSGPEEVPVFGELGRLAKLALTMPVPDRETASVMRAMERMITLRGDCVEDNLDQALNLLLPLKLTVLQDAGECDKVRPTVKHRKFYALEVARKVDFESDVDLFKSNEN